MKLYTVEQVSVILNCHPNTVRKLIKEGILAGFKTARFWKVEKTDLNNYISNLKNKNDK